MGKILRTFASRKLAIILLGLTIFASLVGTMVFDEGQSGEYAKSWWFIMILSLLLLSTTACTARRIAFYLSRDLNQDLNHEEEAICKRSILLKESLIDSLEKVDGILRSLGYKTSYQRNSSEKKIYFFGSKGRVGFLGSILFHLAFLVIGLGVLYSLAFRFSGDFVLVEGTAFVDYLENYHNRKTGMLYNSDHGEFEIKLEKFTPVISQNPKLKLKEVFSEDYISAVSLEDKYHNVVKEELGVNQALKYKGYSIVPDYYGHGFAPKILIKKIPQKGNKEDDGEVNLVKEDFGDGKDVPADRDETLLESFIVLNTSLIGSYDSVAKVQTKVTYKDVIKLEDLDLKLELNFYPQRPKEGEATVETTPFATDPLLTLRAFKLKDSKPFYEGIVDLNKPIKLGSYEFRFVDVKNWQRFLVKKDNGQAVVYFGFSLGLLGLILRFFIYETRIYGLIEGQEDVSAVFLEEDLEKGSLQKSQLDKVLDLLGGQQSDRLGRKSFMDNNRSLF